MSCRNLLKFLDDGRYGKLMTPIRKRNIASFEYPISVDKITTSFSVSANLSTLPRLEMYRQLDFAADATIHRAFHSTEILNTVRGILFRSLREL